MDKIQIFKGFFIGILANGLGLFVVAMTMAKSSGRNDGFLSVLEAAHAENFLGKLISLAALLNLICFFLFYSKEKRRLCRRGIDRYNFYGTYHIYH